MEGQRSENRRGGMGGRGRGERGRGRGGARGPRKFEEEVWTPVTKLGRLVKAKKITDIHEIYLHSLPIKESQIVDEFIPKESLKEEVMRVMSVQKQTAAGQRTRFKSIVLIGDHKGHIGLGVKVSKEVAGAIRGAMMAAKMAMVPVRLGYWGNNIGQPHTVAMKVTGKCGSVLVRLVPAPRGTGLVAAPNSKKVLALAGVEDVFTQSKGKTCTMGNFVKATFFALCKSYNYLTPNLWTKHPFQASPFASNSQWLADEMKPKY
ncbi:putative 40S ribosomal protein S2 [Blattamonas nauphoetae]|uniref:Small ribosomal subunit protein uS5 n=1 Tax=Blattamonas nauphoetae TaxID=2049346 RepID=A0ABQ9XP33_9EUKA|nr:putative 40S ribosomal protein S2 [Blattamonas nauphoetae]